MRALFVSWTFATLLSASLFAQLPKQAAQSVPVASTTPHYDPTRNASTDISSAIAEARASGKRILLEVGGDWCPWCHSLHKLFEEHPDLRTLRDSNYMTVRVFYSREEKNEKALSAFPKVNGIPYFFVLKSDGTLLCAQDAVDLETDHVYDPRKMQDFLTKWSALSTENVSKRKPANEQEQSR
jgi:thiol:disulfide interchange protein